ncbi:MAG TPA: MarR family winged helix-turn-helix transcriptional regulator, partial [Acidimicrobiales bacterium]|nr:MarR family winged helix-turn-helix transcriptional regulator [Acidimicrobiales bacterium]
GLTLPQYRLLAFLSGGPERAAALAGRLDVTRPSLTALVDGAVARGLVERTAAPDDRRGVRHTVTPAGLDALARADAIVATRLAEVSGHLAAADARRVLEGLELLGRALEAAAAERRSRRSVQPVAEGS